jgi:ORF6N domain
MPNGLIELMGVLRSDGRQIWRLTIKVILDVDLAQLYGVTTGNLNLAVRRNPKRFPEDFMFLTQRNLCYCRMQEQKAAVADARDHMPSLNRACQCCPVLSKANGLADPSTGSAHFCAKPPCERHRESAHRADVGQSSSTSRTHATTSRLRQSFW